MKLQNANARAVAQEVDTLKSLPSEGETCWCGLCEADVKAQNDVAIDATGTVVDGIIRYHDAIARLAGRRDVRNDVSRYEAVCVAIVERVAGYDGTIIDAFPKPDSPIRYDRFFETIYDGSRAAGVCHDSRWPLGLKPAALWRVDRGRFSRTFTPEISRWRVSQARCSAAWSATRYQL